MAVTPADVAGPTQPSVGAEPWAIRDLRMLAAVSTAGLLLGFAVNGVGSRLAMLLLARLNPESTGRISDDGFRIGQFGLADTMGLVLFATAAGVLGGLVFLLLRRLRFGPAWFGTAALTVGPAVVVGSSLVHTDGIDFRVLQPVWLAIGLFVALPGLFALAMLRLGDRWLREDSWFLTGSRFRLVALAPVVMITPAFPVLVAVVAGRVAYKSVPALRSAPVQRGAVPAIRLGLAVVFAVALVGLVRDVLVLL